MGLEGRLPQGVYFDWEEGLPVSKYNPPFTKASAAALVAAAAAAPFVPVSQRTEERFYGMSLLEVAAIKYAEGSADGDSSAFEGLLDRLIGKPKQEVTTTNVNITYADYLDSLPAIPDSGEDTIVEAIPEYKLIEHSPSHQEFIDTPMSPAFARYTNLDDI